MSFKMAIVGLGGMGSWHLKNIQERMPGITITGAYDIRDEVKKSIIEKGLKLYETPEQLYSDSEIDLVLVATPNDMHKPYSIALLRSGKNVICEKPVTLNAQDLIEIIQVSEETGKFFTVHQNRRWDSDYLTIKKILSDGILKNPYTIESRVQGSRQALYGWRGYKVNGGGMVYDWGIHLIDQIMDLIPHKVVSVSAHLHNIFAPEVDDNFTAMLRFENGLSAIINIAMNCFILQPRWHMCCEDGTAVIQNWELDGKIVKLASKDQMEWEEEIVYTAAGPTRSMAPRPKDTTQEMALPKVKGEWMEYYKNIVSVLEGKGKLIVTPQQALRVIKVIELIFEADKNGASVECRI